MELDYTWLESPATESHTNDNKKDTGINTHTENKNATETRPTKHYLKIDEERERAREAYAEYQQNKLKSERLRSEINIDLKEGKEAGAILLKAIECISLMTGEAGFYITNKEKIQKIKEL